jgi:hypothetical protein
MPSFWQPCMTPVKVRNGEDATVTWINIDGFTLLQKEKAL